MLYQLSYASPHRLFPAHTAASPGERPFKRKSSTAVKLSQRATRGSEQRSAPRGGSRYFPIGLYPLLPAFLIAATPSSGERSGVVRTLLHNPPAAIAAANAAAETLSGISRKTTVSYSPKLSQPCSSFPPSFSMTAETVDMRFCGFLIRLAHASCEYATCTRNCAICTLLEPSLFPHR